MYYLILTVLILICLAIILLIVFKKIKHIKEDGIKITSRERQIEVKKKLIEARLEKKIFSLARALPGGFSFLMIKGQKKWQSWKQIWLKLFKIKDIFSGRFVRQTKFKRVQPGENLVDSYLAEARLLLRKRRWDEAEDILIKVLELEHKNIEAYMGLGKIYVKRQELDTAEEAFRYIVKIDKKFIEGYKELVKVFELAKKWTELEELAKEILALGHVESWVYAALGLSYKRRGYPEKAEEYFRQAVEIEPQNEKWLDYLLETCIINKNKSLAQKAFNTLSQVCRDEIKLQSYRDKMDLL